MRVIHQMLLFLRKSFAFDGKVLCAIVAVIVLGLPISAQAHPAPFSYLDLVLEEQTINGTITLHLIDVARELQIDESHTGIEQGVLDGQYGAISGLLADRFHIAGAELPPAQWGELTRTPEDDTVTFHFVVDTPPPAALEVYAHFFPDDPAHQTFVNIYEEGQLRQQWIFAADSPSRVHYAGSSAGVVAVMSDFMPSGVHHIMIGPDHILFLIGLILLGGSWRRLALIVTSFTIGHSVTLSLAALGVLAVPAWIIEPLIALSIVIVAADNLLRGEGKDLRAGLAFLFGLIHGFGFAYVLADMGVAGASLGWSLLAFNLGVEIGQLLIVLLAASLLYLVRRRSEKLARQIATIGSLALLAAGAYWFVDRVQILGVG